MNNAIDSRYRNTIVCVDSYDDEVMSGRIYSPYVEGEIVFNSLMSFINIIEELSETMKFPKAFEEKRKFQMVIKESYIIQKAPNEKKGKLATFELKIFFRQNASWQGTCCWLEKNQEESFRSALELFILMSSALKKPEQ